MKKYENFCAALKNLKEIYDHEEPYTSLTTTGLVGFYSICFEQAWKAMKELLEDSGFPEAQTGSPKQILKTAYAAGMIHDEQGWLSALMSRNNVAHSYNQAVALDIIHNCKETYYDLFVALQQEMERNWLS